MTEPEIPAKPQADDSITRRDFVGGSLLGAGVALLGMGSPAAIRRAQAQTVPASMTGLGPDWTGPGGIGDYARSNGNTHEVVNAAHGRNPQSGMGQAITCGRRTRERPPTW